MISKIHRAVLVLVALTIPVIMLAGANTWTGGGVAGTPEGTPGFVSTSPLAPDVVYATFGPVLHRSTDGGRTWVRVREFRQIFALLVHPASPTAIYVSAYDTGDYVDLHVSHDGGQTWTIKLEGATISTLAGSPSNASVVFAGNYDGILHSTDAGDTWSHADFVGTVATLVLHPRQESIAYAGSEGYEYFGDYPGALGMSTDAGRTWNAVAQDSFDSVNAIGVDAVTSATYVATGPYLYGGGKSTAFDVRRSDDGARTWTSAGRGLPAAATRSLVADPRVSGTLYAGTDAGVYRTRDGGGSWTPFGQQLAGTAITSLTIADDGRRLLAATYNGVYELELARGPLDVASSAAGGTRLLAFEGDRLRVGALDASGAWTSVFPAEASPTWTPVAIADAGGDRSQILWQNGDGRSAVERIGPSGRDWVSVFPAFSAWIPADLSVRADGVTHMLWTAQDGRMFIANSIATGASAGPTYGPARGWAAVAIADGLGPDTWVLWRSTDGRAALSVHRNGVITGTYKLGAYLDWSAQDVAVGADGRPRLLRISPSGLASVVTIDGAGRPVAGARYTLPGFTPRRIAAGADGLTRLLFSSDDGQGEVLLLGGDNQLTSKKAVHPNASVVVTTAAELEAAMTPANAGKQILVRAGEYQVAHALTVPDRATVVGEGEMLFDASGLPAGMAAAGRTVVRSTAELEGDVLTLGNGSALRGLVIEDAEGRSTGNAVAVVSRKAGDSVSARIDACEIVNPNPSGAAPPGPTGRGVVVYTRNPNLAFDPPAHVGAALSLRMSQSIIHSPAAAIGLFAINFADQGKIDVDLTGNVIGGGLTASGGVSRPEAVTGAAIDVRSRGNLYRSDSADPTPVGWSLSGGSTAVIPNIVSEASTSNSLRIHSTDDRIEGFVFAIFGAGGQRVIATSEPISFNTLELNLQGTRSQSLAGDLSLVGGLSFEPGVSPGDGNLLKLNVRQATGSGPRGNSYANSSEGLGEGNRLVVIGSPNAFDHTNTGIDPAPPTEFFTAQP